MKAVLLCVLGALVACHALVLERQPSLAMRRPHLNAKAGPVACEQSEGSCAFSADETAPALVQVTASESRKQAKSGSSSAESSDCDCECEDACGEESGEESGGCDCKCKNPCSEFDRKMAERQEQKPALRTLVVIAGPTKPSLDPDIQEAVDKFNEEHEMCKMMKAEGKPCKPSFLEQASCSRFRECQASEPACVRIFELCKPDMVAPLIVDDLSNANTVQPELLPNRCTDDKRDTTCCKTAIIDDSACCRQCVPGEKVRPEIRG